MRPREKAVESRVTPEQRERIEGLWEGAQSGSRLATERLVEELFALGFGDAAMAAYALRLYALPTAERYIAKALA